MQPQKTGGNEDAPVLDRIQQLASEEHRIYAQDSISDADRERLEKIKVELDQSWDLLRQREALRQAGRTLTRRRCATRKLSKTTNNNGRAAWMRAVEPSESVLSHRTWSTA